MTPATKNPATPFIDSIRKGVEKQMVVFEASGPERVTNISLDRPFTDARGTFHEGGYDDDIKDMSGNVIKRIRFRNFEPGVTGHQSFDPNGKTPKPGILGSSDMEMIARLREWIAEHKSGDHVDQRIDKYGISELPSGTTPQPFQNFANIDADVLGAMIANMLTGDEAKDAAFLDQCARYELQRGDDARDDVLLAIEDLTDGVIDLEGAEVDESEVGL